jgi:hypothetical protein
MVVRQQIDNISYFTTVLLFHQVIDEKRGLATARLYMPEADLPSNMEHGKNILLYLEIQSLSEFDYIHSFHTIPNIIANYVTQLQESFCDRSIRLHLLAYFEATGRGKFYPCRPSFASNSSR